MGIAIELLFGVLIGFIAPWWIRYAFASKAIKKAGLRLKVTFDTMFLTVPFFGFAVPFWLNGRLPAAFEQMGIPQGMATLISMPVILVIPFVCYRLAAFLPGVSTTRAAIAEVDRSMDSKEGRLLAGLPVKKLEV